MALSLAHNTPSVGHISWTGLHIVYKGIDYTIDNGSTNLKFAWWDHDDPNELQVSNTTPTLDVDDVLVFYNKNGIGLVVPNASLIEGGLITTGSIIADALAANAVTADKIAANAVTAEKILADAIGAEAIAAGVIIADHLAAGAITTDKLAANAVTAAKIAAGTITATEIAANAITASELDAEAVTGKTITGGLFRTSTPDSGVSRIEIEGTSVLDTIEWKRVNTVSAVDQSLAIISVFASDSGASLVISAWTDVDFLSPVEISANLEVEGEALFSGGLLTLGSASGADIGKLDLYDEDLDVNAGTPPANTLRQYFHRRSGAPNQYKVRFPNGVMKVIADDS